MGFKRGDPGCPCCGCTILQQRFAPDYLPIEAVRCIRTVRTVTTTTTTRTQRTTTWVGGVGTDVDVTLSNVVTTTDVTVESVTRDMQAGRFTYSPRIFRSTLIPPYYAQSSTGTPGVNGTTIYQPRQWVTKTYVVTEEARLCVTLDGSSEHLFGENDENGDPWIKTATLYLGVAHYQPAPTGSMPAHQRRIFVRGLLPDEDAPTTPAEFDALWGTTSNEYDGDYTSGSASQNNVMSWLPTAHANEMHLLFFTPNNNHGALLTDTTLMLADRVNINRSTNPYDWAVDWVRPDINTWETRNPLPSDNFQLTLDDVLPVTYWSRSLREFTVELFTRDSGSETVLVSQVFSNRVGTPRLLTGGAYSYPWLIESSGTFGDLLHVTAWTSFADIPYLGVDNPYYHPSLGFAVKPSLKVRGAVVELGGAYSPSTRDEDGLLSQYLFTPYWHDWDQVDRPNMYLRLVLDGHQMLNLHRQTGLRHDVDEVNQTCPANYTNGVIDDYAHHEWRVIDFSLPGYEAAVLPTAYNHVSATLGSEGVSDTLQGGVTGSPPNNDLIVDTSCDAQRYVRTETAWYQRNLPGGGLDVPQAVTNVEIEGWSVHPSGGPTDVSGVVRYTTTVRVYEVGGYTTQTVSGLPGAFDSFPGGVVGLPPYSNRCVGSSAYPRYPRLNEYLLVKSGNGAGLVFRCTGIASVAAVANPFASPAWLYVPTFDVEHVSQRFVPVLTALPDAGALAGLAVAVPGVTYWVQFNERFYPVLDGIVGTSLDALPSDTLDDGVVEVHVRVVPQCASGGSDLVSYTELPASVSYGPDDTEPTLDTTPPGFIWDDPLVILPPNSPSGTWTFHHSVVTWWRMWRTATAGGVLNVSAMARDPLCWFVKRVARWHDRDMPELTFTGADAQREYDYNLQDWADNTHTKANEVELLRLEYYPSSGLPVLRFKWTGQTVDLLDLEITIGPSTYTP